MNWQGFFQFALLALVSLGVLPGSNHSLFAQTGRATTQPQKRERPSSNTLRLQEQRLSPDLERILKEWSDSSSKIQKLQGEHYRWVYDHTFQVTKRAKGVFYYEAPDKGRIDIQAVKVGRGEKDKRNYKVQSDKPERWIANGSEIRKIDDAQKTVEVFLIPPQARGRHIMDGPLPFLFGMPPEKAKRRFRFKLLEETDSVVRLQIWPQLLQDRANWKEALVILKKPYFLPDAVKLIDPAGTADTAYQFGNLKVNKARTIFEKVTGRDWTNPKLASDYRTHINEPQQMKQPNGKTAGKIKQVNQTVTPSFVGLGHDKAKQIIEQLGCTISVKRGARTTNPKLQYRVQTQSPKPKTPLSKGQKIILYFYDKPAATSQKNSRTRAK